jgi:hypothetical protein
MQRLFIASFLALLASLAPASAQLANENLLLTVPPGYKIDFQEKEPGRLISEMVPEGQTVHNWTEMLTVEIFYNLKATPTEFVDRLAQLWINACPGGSSKSVASGLENGYPAGLWILACAKNPGTGMPEITWVKAVQGNDSFYVVQKAFKFDPSKDQIAWWTKYLRSVAVCDPRVPGRACPQAKN